MNNTIIFTVAIICISGLIFGRLAKFIKLPNVTGYLIAGLILGPCVFNIIHADIVEDFSLISDIALAFIAFSVGSEFKMSYFKKVGISPIIIAVTESVGAIILVTGTLLIFGFDVKLSILLGAIAAATAPAQTIMVIQQYKAKGPLTSMLLSVVALDDAVALIGFGFAVAIVNSIGSSSSFSVLSVLKPFYEVICSFVLGIIIGILMIIFFRWFKKHTNRLCVIVGFLLFSTYLSNLIGASPLLTCMAVGATVVNLFDDIDDVMNVTDGFTSPIFMIFFVISGAGFDLGALKAIGIIGIIYVIMRVAGKCLGSWFGAAVTKQDSKIKKYLGPTLMPQAGVALGLLVVAGNLVPQFAPQLKTIILCSTFIYSIIGPVAAKIALVKSGEIVLENNKSVKK